MDQRKTPLCTALTERAAAGGLRMHMPGHKGHWMPELFAAVAAIDYTELEGTGNLYEGTGSIAEAEALMAGALGADQAFFLTGGSSQGAMAALSLVAEPGDAVLLDRNCHRSVYHAAALLGLEPKYLWPELLADFAVPGPVRPEAVEQALKEHPGVKAFCLTSPNYYGVISPVAEIAEVCRRFGVRLVVDEAHGAHLPFIGLGPCAQGQGADLSFCSFHKTMPALGQAAVLCAGAGFLPEIVRRKTALFGTSSPSYPIMASLDWARAHVANGEGQEDYLAAARLCRELWQKINDGTAFAALEDREDLELDPARLCVRTSGAGLTGFEADRLLREMGIVAELADRDHVVLILTGADDELDFDTLFTAFERLSQGRQKGSAPQGEALPRPAAACSPREAMLAPAELVTLGESLGRIAARELAPYPPGVPVAAPGERIDEAVLAWLLDRGFDREQRIPVRKEI